MTGHTPSRGFVELGELEALELAATMPVGRLAHLHDDQLFVTPVNFVLEGVNVLLRTAEGTALLAAARAGAQAAFEVDDLINWSRTGWSVLIRGRLREVSHAEVFRWALDTRVRPWAEGERKQVVRLAGEKVTGRRIEPGPGGVTVVQH